MHHTLKSKNCGHSKKCIHCTTSIREKFSWKLEKKKEKKESDEGSNVLT